MDLINQLINFAKSPIGILLLIIGFYLFFENREHLDTTDENIGDFHPDQAAPKPGYIDQISTLRSTVKVPAEQPKEILKISETPTRKDRHVQLAIDPKTGEKLPPTVYEETRLVLPTGETKEGQQVWKQVVKRSSTYLPEEVAKKQAKQSLDALPRKVNTTITFTEKAVKLANQDPQLAATLINKQGLSGYLKTSGKDRQEAASQLGMTMEEINQTLAQELKLDPAELEVKYRADGELSGDITLELKRKLEDAKRKLQVRRTAAQKIQQAEPDFQGIQSNWIQ